MLLAGDVGGTKTFLGLFRRGVRRPDSIEARAYRTLDFPDLGALCLQFLRETSTSPADIEAASFGVAGPITGTRAQLTNVPWTVDLDTLRDEVPIPRAYLLNDLEALAWSVPVLMPDEIEVLHEGHADPDGSVALIAAGTGLGIALLPRVDGRLVPRASEGGHVDFAARNSEEQALANVLIKEHRRVDVECVVSGPGLANIHRILHPHQCAALTPMPSSDELPAAISRSALETACPLCLRTLECFVSAYGASAGNLALTVLSTGGLYLGGGIAPRILRALRWPVFMRSFLEKSPMDALIARIPVKVILNPRAGLLGAASYADSVGSR
ncbi:MAG: glucokinase [Vicinamibacterales bacterium]